MTSLEDWTNHRNEVAQIEDWTWLVVTSIIFAASVLVFVLIKCVYKKNETILIAITFLFFLKALVELPKAISYAYYDKFEDEGGEEGKTLYRLGALGDCFDFFAQWLFSCQYLKTAMLFSIVFAQADFATLPMNRDSYNSDTL